ncbi:hypothetical protein RFI_04388 [Reticulomyxa filosa]|uniref:G domain-containing protein n=1 Tax=Reticulomyxa filosa TaxID=46433 RepID=X6P3M4_RETFI|nr:hypothetical protein RFI_04388 [Reticulomyxa filosa]|eukprot:ETO32728.1 hypothetical protein RFI_04388 [Reticulomyxa filosa]
MSEVYVLLVGSTGVGKSAHVRLLTGDEKVKVSDGAKSCTTEMSIYTGSNGYNYIDTVGAEDSENLSDEFVLNQTQRDLYKAKVKKMKIIWISNPNERESSTLQKQARYIGVIDKDIWKSVLAIVKQPSVDLETESQGIKTAIKEYCKKPDIPVPVIGYRNIDWVKSAPKRILPLSFEDRAEEYWLYSNEIHDLIIQKLNSLQATELYFEEKKCQKCSLVGEPRFSDDVKCHLDAKKVHKNGVEPKQVHPGEKQPIHDPSHKLEWYHPDDSLHHPGQAEKFHDKAHSQ